VKPEHSAAYGDIAVSCFPLVIQEEAELCKAINEELRRSSRGNPTEQADYQLVVQPRERSQRRFHSFEDKTQREYLWPDFVSEHMQSHRTMVAAVKSHLFSSEVPEEGKDSKGSKKQSAAGSRWPSATTLASHEALTHAIVIDTIIGAQIPNARAILEVTSRRLQALMYVHAAEDKTAAWDLARRLESKMVRRHLPNGMQVTAGLYAAAKERQTWHKTTGKKE
jgi:hypothetical protein